MACGGKTTNKIKDYSKNAARIRKLMNKTLKITITYAVLAMCKETIKRKGKATPTKDELRIDLLTPRA